MEINPGRTVGSLPTVSFGPFRFLEALPWLILAAAMRIVAFSGGATALPAIAAADVAILMAYMAVSRRSIELSGGQSGLGRLAFRDQLKLSLMLLGKIAVLMVMAFICVAVVAGKAAAPHALFGLDGMAFDQWTFPGMFWSATIAALILLMIIRAEQRGSLEPELLPALKELFERFRWLAATIAVIGVMHIVLHFIQAGARWLVYVYWITSAEDSTIKLYVFFGFIVTFATLRIWITLLVLTYGLRQSYLRQWQDPAANPA